MIDDDRLAELMELFFSGTLGNEDAKELLTYLQSHPEANRFFLSNIEADFYLEQAARGCIENVASIYPFGNSSPADQLKTNLPPKEEIEEKEPVFTTAEDFFSEMVQYEKNAKPIRNEVEPEPVKPTWFQKWILPKIKKKGNPNETVQSAVLSAKSRKRSNYFFATRLVLFVAFISWLCFEGNRKPVPVPSIAFEALGRVTEIVDVVWGKDSPVYKRGQPLGSERFTIVEGVVKVVLNSGAELILESPGSYSMPDAMKCRCEWGKVSAHIPKDACGFEVISPHGRFVDRGTDFYIDVQPDKTDMGVMVGQVDYEQKDGTFLPIKKGQEIRVPESGSPLVSLCSGTRYLNEKYLLPLLENYFARWKREKTEKALEWNSDPNLLVRLDMDHEGKETIPNLSLRGQTQITSALPVSISTQSGMTPTSQAWKFNEGSFVHFDLPGKYKSFSLMANIQIDQLPNMANVLFSSGDMGKTQGAIIWQITNDGMLQLQISMGDKKAYAVYDSPVRFTHKSWGTWVNIAVVMDAKRQRIRHYIDGKMISSTLWKKPVSIVPGTAYIGNIKQQRTRNKYHLGCPMADFMVFDYPMTENDFKKYLLNP